MYKAKISAVEKIRAAEAYLNGKSSVALLADGHGVRKSTVRDWIRIYKTFGAEGLADKCKSKKYDTEVKEAAVKAYLAKEGSLSELCKRFKISSLSLLRDWIKLYNGHKELCSRGGHGSEIYMTSGRTTTYEERIEIVSFCIESGKDYPTAIEKYGVSYQQIYSWVRKYEEQGAQALVDRRGKRKDVDEMSEVEQLRAENRLLKAEIKQTELENAVLKKVKEIERRGY